MTNLDNTISELQEVLEMVNELPEAGSGDIVEAPYDCEVDFNIIANVAYTFDAYDSSASAPVYGITFPFGGVQFRETYNNTLFKRGSLFYLGGSQSGLIVSNVETTGDIEIIDEGDNYIPVVLKINGNGTITFTK